MNRLLNIGIRLASSAGLIIMVVLTIFIANVAIFAVFGMPRTVTYAALATGAQVLVAVPALAVLCLVRGDGRKARVRAGLLSIVPICGFSLLWLFVIGFWYRELFRNWFTEWSMLIGIAEGLAFAGMMILSGFLASHFLPSLRGRAGGPRPKSIRHFTISMTMLLVFYVAATIVTFGGRVQELTPAEIAQYLGHDFGRYFLMVSFLSFFLYQAVLLLGVVVRGSKTARVGLLALFIETMLFALPAQIALLQKNPIAFGMFLYIMAFHAFSLYLAYTPAANRWFEGATPEDAAPAVESILPTT